MELDGSVVTTPCRTGLCAGTSAMAVHATVGIELAHATNWEDFSAQWDQAVAWAGDYLNSRGWGIDRLLSHNDCTWIWGGSDHTDPTGYFAEYGRSGTSSRRRSMPTSAVVTRRPALAIRPAQTGIEVQSERCSHHLRGIDRPPPAAGGSRDGGPRTPAAPAIRSPVTAMHPIRWLAIDMPGWYQVRGSVHLA